MRKRLTSLLSTGTPMSTFSMRLSGAIVGADFEQSATMMAACPICWNLVQLTMPSFMSCLTSCKAVRSCKCTPLDFGQARVSFAACALFPESSTHKYGRNPGRALCKANRYAAKLRVVLMSLLRLKKRFLNLLSGCALQIISNVSFSRNSGCAFNPARTAISLRTNNVSRGSNACGPAIPVVIVHLSQLDGNVYQLGDQPRTMLCLCLS